MAYMPYYNDKRITMIDFTVVAYEKENGEVPVEDFLTQSEKSPTSKR